MTSCRPPPVLPPCLQPMCRRSMPGWRHSWRLAAWQSQSHGGAAGTCSERFSALLCGWRAGCIAELLSQHSHVCNLCKMPLQAAGSGLPFVCTRTRGAQQVVVLPAMQPIRDPPHLLGWLALKVG